MNDILDALSARFKAPWFGYAVLAFIAFNWRGIFLLTTTEGMPQVRLAAFDSATSHWTLFAWPALSGLIATTLTPWTRFAFAWLAKRPFFLADNLQIESEHHRTMRKAELERSRAALLAAQEAEIIERAKRDVEVLQIGDAEVQGRAEAKLEALRRERDAQSGISVSGSIPQSLSASAIELLSAAATDKSGIIERIGSLGGRSIQAGNRVFGGSGAREFLKYEEALEMLMDRELVKPISNKAEIYELTYLGWTTAETL